MPQLEDRLHRSATSGAAASDVRAPAAGPPPADEPPGPTEPSDPGRAGAVWVTATGVCCMLAAAALFLAVRWDTLPDQAKFGVLAALTATAVLAGRGLSRRLPATGGVLFHLGILLLPLDVVAASRPLDRPWEEVAAVTAAATAACWWLVGRSTRSAVLGWGAAAAVAVAAGAVGARSGVPAPLLLAGAAVVAASRRADRCALGWALLAGVAPLLGGLQAVLDPAVDALTAIGADPSVPGIQRLATGLLAAAALGTVAHRRRDLTLVVAAAAVGSVGLIGFVADVVPHPDAAGVLLATGVVLVLVEVVAHLLRTDPFWHLPARRCAEGVELLAALAVLVTVQIAVLVSYLQWVDPHEGAELMAQVGSSATVALASVLNAVGWVLAELRRASAATGAAIDGPDTTGTAASETDGVVGRSAVLVRLVAPGWLPTTIAVTASLASAAAVIGTPAVALPMLATLVLLLAGCGRQGAPWCAATVAALVVLLPTDGTATEQALVGIAGVVATLAVAVLARRLLQARNDTLTAWTLAVAAPVLAGVAVVRGAVAAHPQGVLDAEVAAVTMGVLIVVWSTVAALLDGDRPTRVGAEPRWGLGLPCQVTALTVACGSVLVVDAAAALWIVVVAALVNTVDLARTRNDLNPASLVLLLPVAGGLAPLALGYPTHYAAVGLALTAVVAGGVATLGGEELRSWTDGLVILALVPALLVGSLDAIVFGVVLLAAATVAGMRAASELSGGWAAAAASLALVGVWIELLAAEVTSLDAYAAPLAVALLGAGTAAHRQGMSSWVAYTPSVALLGGTALVERIAGGGWPHAVVAGAVGVSAVVAGGWRLLAGPLLVGSAVLATLVVHESLAVTAGVPTWVWLAVAGALLIGAGIAMERSATTPFRAGQRVVEVLTTRFS